MPAALVDRHLPEAVAVLATAWTPRGSSPRRAAGDRQPEGNLLPNVDYDACFAAASTMSWRAPAFAPAVAEPRWAWRSPVPRDHGCDPRCVRAPRSTVGLQPRRVPAAGRRRRRRRGRRPRPAPARAAGAVRLPRARAYPATAGACAAGAEPCALDALLRASRVVFVSRPRRATTRRCSGGARAQLTCCPTARASCSRAAPRWPTSTHWCSAPRPGACARRSTCGPRSRWPRGTRRAPRTACCSARIAPAGCPRPSARSASWPSATSSWCCAAYRPRSAPGRARDRRPPAQPPGGAQLGARCVRRRLPRHAWVRRLRFAACPSTRREGQMSFNTPEQDRAGGGRHRRQARLPDARQDVRRRLPRRRLHRLRRPARYRRHLGAGPEDWGTLPTLFFGLVFSPRPDPGRARRLGAAHRQHGAPADRRAAPAGRRRRGSA